MTNKDDAASGTQNADRPKGADSKDFIEHLRTVHFALVATCLALLAITLSPSPEAIRKANEELKEISEVAHNWDWGWQNSAITEKLKGQHEYSLLSCNQLPFHQVSFARDGDPFVAEFQGNNWGLGYPRLEPEDHHGPASLEEFRRYWDTDITVLCPYHTADQIDFFDRTLGGKGEEQIPLSSAQVSSVIEPNPKARHAYGEFEIGPGNSGNMGEYYAEITDSDPDSHTPTLYEIHIPVDKSVTVSVSMRDQIIKSYPQYQWVHSGFKDAFEDLDKGTTGFQDLDFGHLKAVLELQAANSKDTLEAFGIKFPRGLTTRWGVLLILGIQLYLWIHLAECRKRAFQSSDIAWIGSYKSAIARWIFAGTALLAPVGVIAFLCFYKTGLLVKPMPNAFLSSVTLAVAIMLSLSSGREYRKIHIA